MKKPQFQYMLILIWIVLSNPWLVFGTTIKSLEEAMAMYQENPTAENKQILEQAQSQEKLGESFPYMLTLFVLVYTSIRLFFYFRAQKKLK